MSKLSKVNKFLKDYSFYAAFFFYFLGCFAGATYFNPREKKLQELRKENLKLEIKLLEMQTKTIR